MNSETKILIVGLGLIGGSYAKGLTKKGYKVYGMDTNEESVKFALDNNYVIEGYTKCDDASLSDKDIIILGLYPSYVTSWVKDNQKYIKSDALITDVCGIKCSYLKDVKEILGKDLTYIPHHPMAGRELSGIKNSNELIFRGANFIITPSKGDDHSKIAIIKEIGNALEFKNIVELTPEKHDEMIGFLSQLTHVIAISLMTSRECTHFATFTGDSFRDLTRIAHINENMWSELFLENKDILINEIDTFIKQVEKVKQTLVNNDEESLKEIMRLSTDRRSYFDK